MSEHTKEPWTVDGPALGAVYADDQPLLQVFQRKAGSGVILAADNARRDADAARIVACVNALAGVSDPAAAIKLAREALGAYLSDNDSGVAYSHDTESKIRAAFLALGGEQ